MSEQSRFVPLEYVATHLDEVIEQTAKAAMILTNGGRTPVAAIVVGKTLEDIHREADELYELGESPGFGVAPYFLPFDELRAALHHCQCKLRNNNTVVMQLPVDGEYTLLALIPLTPSAKLTLAADLLQSSR